MLLLRTRPRLLSTGVGAIVGAITGMDTLAAVDKAQDPYNVSEGNELRTFNFFCII